MWRLQTTALDALPPKERKERNMHSIGIFVPYFGRIPRWFDLFLESCKANPSINFYLFSDYLPDRMLLPNVRVESMTLQQFIELASRRLAINIAISSAYKICDFKPAFGDIFGVAVLDLDFWGYCDIDIIFGNMRKFLGHDILCGFDIISAARQFMAGPFSIFRNSPLINTLYRRSTHFHNVFETDKCKSFDELGPYVKWKKNGDFVRKRTGDFESFTDVVVAARNRGNVRALFGLRYYNDPDTAIHKYSDVLWKRGDLINLSTNDHLFMYHFQNGKRSFRSWYVPKEADFTNGFLITRSGFCRAPGISR
jgi:hypothetical protein